MKQSPFKEAIDSRSGERPQETIRLLSCPDQICYTVTCGRQTLATQNRISGRQTLWCLYEQSKQWVLEWEEAEGDQPVAAELLAAIEAVLTRYPQQKMLLLGIPQGCFSELFEVGILIMTGEGRVAVYAEMFWQQARVWCLSHRDRGFPLRYILNQGRRHPLRPPKPTGVVYRRYIPWLGRTLLFRSVDPVTDLQCFNRWMNDPAVAEFWQESGDFARHRAYLETIRTDPHVINLMACLDEEPFGYFEVYWAKEDRIAPFYDAGDFDRGWHVLIGEPHRRGKPFVTAWLPSISHYLFLDDDRTQRIVIEPRIDNHKMMRNLAHCGYAQLKAFDFPHKRAVLNMLLRERFFSEQLWVPGNSAIPQPVTLS